MVERQIGTKSGTGGSSGRAVPAQPVGPALLPAAVGAALLALRAVALPAEGCRRARQRAGVGIVAYKDVPAGAVHGGTRYAQPARRSASPSCSRRLPWWPTSAASAASPAPTSSRLPTPLLPAHRRRGPRRPRPGRRLRRRVRRTASSRKPPAGHRHWSGSTRRPSRSTAGPSGHTVVEVVTDDMPFLVDSVTMSCSRQDRRSTSSSTRRSSSAATSPASCSRSATTARPTRARRDAGDAVVESWMHVEIDRETDRPRRARSPTGCAGSCATSARRSRTGRRCAQARRQIADELRDRAAAGDLPDGGRRGAASCCAGWPTTTSPSSATASTCSTPSDGEDVLRAVPGTGLGILRADQAAVGRRFGELPAEVRAKARETAAADPHQGQPPRHRAPPAYLDYVGVKKFDERRRGRRRAPVPRPVHLGRVHRERAAHPGAAPQGRRRCSRTVGLRRQQPLAARTCMRDPRDLPARRAVPDPGRRAAADRADRVCTCRSAAGCGCSCARTTTAGYMSCLVYLPRDRYTTDVRARDQDDPARGDRRPTSIDYTAWVTESVLARLHFVVRMRRRARRSPTSTSSELEAAARRGHPVLGRRLRRRAAQPSAARRPRPRCSAATRDAFPEAYKEDFAARGPRSPTSQRLEELSRRRRSAACNLYQPPAPAARRAPVQDLPHRRAALAVAVLPVLQRMGVEVVDERPVRDRAAPAPTTAWVYDFGLRLRRRAAAAERPDGLQELFQEAFAAIWAARPRATASTRWCCAAGLTWRQAMVLRAYAKYLRQAGSTFSQDYIEECLGSQRPDHPAAGRAVRGAVRPGPLRGRPRRRRRPRRSWSSSSSGARRGGEPRPGPDPARPSSASSARRCAPTTTSRRPGRPAARRTSRSSSTRSAIPDLPAPRPKYEIWVYSPRVEGVHLRFGPVARGGLRWSDRREDFRTEVLGLVKAQMVKNAVIVPVGAKGGFVGKQLPDPAVDREAWLAEGIACYKTFISACSTSPTTWSAGERRAAAPGGPPRRRRHLPRRRRRQGHRDVLRHRQRASRRTTASGSATRSPPAARPATTTRRWASPPAAPGSRSSGTSASWAATPRPRTSPSSASATCPATCSATACCCRAHPAGRRVRPPAHLPRPDPDAGDLVRRAAPPVRAAALVLGRLRHGADQRGRRRLPAHGQVDPDHAAGPGRRWASPTTSPTMTPAELMRAILRAPVDLLWNGGIGTYVKASHRVARRRRRQGQRRHPGRRQPTCASRSSARAATSASPSSAGSSIAPAPAGGRINTDAIDNSAGVDTSDHEVNIKILLDRRRARRAT